jgi:hypothetical protein
VGVDVGAVVGAVHDLGLDLAELVGRGLGGGLVLVESGAADGGEGAQQ